MKASNPVFAYVSDCCNIAATKEPCERTKDEKAAGEFGTATLGTWRCRCGKKCKVSRHKIVDNSNKQE